MNIYLLNEDGESFCIRANTMGEAVKICEASYLEDRQESESDKYDEDVEREYYYEQVLQSCLLIGQLKN